MVGNWLRNFELANEVFCKLLEKNPNQIINVICSKENNKFFTNRNIHCFCGISDVELRELYWKSNVVFLPLLRFTANNALLEASACGCNIVIASEQIENSYLPHEFITILEPKFETCVSYLESINKSNANITLCNFVTNYYSWKNIANLTLKILNS